MCVLLFMNNISTYYFTSETQSINQPLRYKNIIMETDSFWRSKYYHNGIIMCLNFITNRGYKICAVLYFDLIIFHLQYVCVFMFRYCIIYCRNISFVLIICRSDDKCRPRGKTLQREYRYWDDRCFSFIIIIIFESC